jgi:hypothetical protein
MVTELHRILQRYDISTQQSLLSPYFILQGHPESPSPVGPPSPVVYEEKTYEPPSPVGPPSPVVYEEKTYEPPSPVGPPSPVVYEEKTYEPPSPVGPRNITQRRSNPFRINAQRRMGVMHITSEEVAQLLNTVQRPDIEEGLGHMPSVEHNVKKCLGLI